MEPTIELGDLTRLTKKQLINILTILVKYCEYERLDKNILCNLEYLPKEAIQLMIDAALEIVNTGKPATEKTIPTVFVSYRW